MNSRMVCTICARGGSVGVPGKNIRPLLGKPLLAYSIEQARASGLFDCIAVSSDHPDILSTAKTFGADLAIARPPAMATSEAAKVPAIAHAVQTVESITGVNYDINVDLDATSPLRRPEDIRGAVALLVSHDATSVITAAPAHRSPYFNLVERDANHIVRLSKTLPQNVVRRQDSPACFDMNASIYVWNKARFLADPKVFYDDTRLFEMPRERSIDIDDELDFDIVELIMKRRLP
ncbi:MAG: acylneuraminate cytidylyltransferase family protein [Alphaproteobacteria bacterium]|nr:acylneuraminate cytidylyltransferase family protein [Alphaproteobacteria bacterium]